MRAELLNSASLVRTAAQSATKSDIAELKAALGENEAAILDSQRFYETDVAFHGVLYRITGNPALTAMHAAYIEWLSPDWPKMPRLPERNRANFLAHTEIFNAILMPLNEHCGSILMMLGSRSALRSKTNNWIHIFLKSFGVPQ